MWSPSLPAALAECHYVVSNLTDGTVIEVSAGSEPGGGKYDLPLGAKVAIWCVPNPGYEAATLRLRADDPPALTPSWTELAMVAAMCGTALRAADDESWTKGPNFLFDTRE